MTALLPESKIPNEVQEVVSEAHCLLFKRKLGGEDVNKHPSTHSTLGRTCTACSFLSPKA